MSTSEDLCRHYSGFYSTGNESEWRRLGAIGKADNIVKLWGGLSEPRPHVVEIGCGDGAVAARLAELDFFASYRGFDISESGISEAAGRCLANASFSTCGSSIPLGDDSADLVIMSHVIEHLEHPRQLLYEARRIAPLLIAEVPLELNRSLPNDYDWNPVGHINKYNRKAIRQLVQTCQFDVLEQFTTNVSRDVACYRQSRIAGNLKWAIKQSALQLFPNTARSLFTYHQTLLARRNQKHHASSSPP